MPVEDDPHSISGLQDLEDEVSADFLPKIRRSLNRRQTSADLVGFSWYVPRAILMELLSLNGGKKEKGK